MRGRKLLLAEPACGYGNRNRPSRQLIRLAGVVARRWSRGLLAPILMLALVQGAGVVRAETVADLRAQLTTLDGQVQQLRDALVRQGAATGLPAEPASALVRLDQLEAELRRITDRLDVLTNDIDRIVKDAYNRVGDFEFRLTELEGGDVSLLGSAG